MKAYYLFDGRYRTNPDRATCYERCDTLKEAKTNCKDYGTDTVIVLAEEKDNEAKFNEVKFIKTLN